jgi:AcrR family transcriptional regulator
MRSGDLQDPRAQRTRRRLLLEFERQLERGGVAPSVTSLIQAAAVSRSAFYSHFASLEDLHAAAVRQVLDDFGSSYDNLHEPARGGDDVAAPGVERVVRGTESDTGDHNSGRNTADVAGLRDGEDTTSGGAAPDDPAPEAVVWLPCETLFEHIGAHRHLFTPVFAGVDAQLEQLRCALVEQCCRAIDRAPMRPCEVDSLQAATFIVGGVLACLARWLADPAAASASQLAAQVTALVPPWLQDGPGVRVEVIHAEVAHVAFGCIGVEHRAVDPGRDHINHAPAAG